MLGRFSTYTPRTLALTPKRALMINTGSYFRILPLLVFCVVSRCWNHGMREIFFPKVLSFTMTALLEETAQTSANVSIGDMNGDGYLYLLLVKGRH